MDAPHIHTRKTHTSYVVAGAGLLTLLAFFAMPLASLPVVGSVTGANVAALASKVGSLALLWLVPICAVVITGTGVWQSLPATHPPTQRRIATVMALVAAGAAVLVYLAVLVGAQNQLAHTSASRLGISALSLAGAGFWIGLLALAAAGIAALLDLVTSKA